MKDEISSWIYQRYGVEKMNPGLERVNQVLENLFPYFEQTKIITIAGTNGKGETALRLSTLLSKHHHFVWTSPHIQRITERMRNEEGEISLEVLRPLLYNTHEKVQKMGLRPSYYEFLFLVFCTWASRSRPDFLILEVGLGGRLDAVNAFDADIVLLPSISRDHQEILGKRYDQILKEKLGTLRKKTTLIHFLHSEYLIQKAKEIAESVGADSLSLKKMVPLPEYEFSMRNWYLANAAFSHLFKEKISPSEWNSTCDALLNRGELILGKQTFILYGSHNVDGMRKLIQFLKDGTYTFPKPSYDAVLVSFSQRDPKDIRVMMKMLKRAMLGKIFVIYFDHPKAMDQKVLEALCIEEGSYFVDDLEKFLEGLAFNEHLLVTGSYYFLGKLKQLLGK